MFPRVSKNFIPSQFKLEQDKITSEVLTSEALSQKLNESPGTKNDTTEGDEEFIKEIKKIAEDAKRSKY